MTRTAHIPGALDNGVPTPPTKNQISPS